jgi:hypothetical protein
MLFLRSDLHHFFAMYNRINLSTFSIKQRQPAARLFHEESRKPGKRFSHAAAVSPGVRNRPSLTAVCAHVPICMHRTDAHLLQSHIPGGVKTIMLRSAHGGGCGIPGICKHQYAGLRYDGGWHSLPEEAAKVALSE